MNTAAHVLTVLGILGVVEFVIVTFCARQLAGTAVPRLRRRVDAPLVHYAPAWAGFSAAVLAIGLALTAR